MGDRSDTLKIIVEKKPYWYQVYLQIEGTKAEWHRVVGIITLLAKRVIIRDPVFLEDTQTISLFYWRLDATKLIEEIRKEYDCEEV